jgi:hypothetical protein
MLSKLYLELGTRITDDRLLDLLRFPAESCFPKGVRWSAQWWSDGKSRTMRNFSREKILEKVARDGTNELQIRCKATNVAEGRTTGIVGGWFWFNPSPFSELWTPVPETKLSRRSDELKRRIYLGTQNAKEKGFRLTYPSVLECCEIEFSVAKSDATDAELQSYAIEIIRSGMPLGLSKRVLFGYGCLRGECRKQMMLQSLAPWPGAVDELGPKFESLYPILVGPKSTCDAIHNAIGDLAQEFDLSNDSETSILSIPSKDVERLAGLPEVQKWLVDRSERTHFTTWKVKAD